MYAFNQRKSSISIYSENEILENSENLYNHILSESLFSQKKIIIVNRASDKILKIIEYLNEKSFSDVFIIINAKNLEKKSKLRSFFEKSKEFIAIAFYPDNNQTLAKNAALFFNENNCGCWIELNFSFFSL